MSSSEDIAAEFLPLVITQTALRTAQQFADTQPTPAKKEQVYLNTLAVCIVNDYMQMMDIATDLRASDSWNAAMRLYADVADLKLTDLGYLECRPLKFGNCYIPPEVPENRIGVVVVDLDLKHATATLVGFAQPVRAGKLTLNQLQSIDDLLQHLEQLERYPSVIDLSQWLQNSFSVGWQSVEEILTANTPQLAFRYHNGITRAKLIDLGIRLPSQLVVLVVTLMPQTTVAIHIRVQVYPTGEAYLPDQLTIRVIDAEGMAVMTAHAQTASAHITLEFSAQPGETFSVDLELGDTNVTENFVI